MNIAQTLARWRVRLGYLLAILVLWVSRPVPRSILYGAILGAIGLFVRARAAGYLHKQQILTVTGPYAHTRNPLYLGSAILALGALLFFWLEQPGHRTHSRAAMGQGERLYRAFPALAAALACLGLVMSGSRTAILALCVALSVHVEGCTVIGYAIGASADAQHGTGGPAILLSVKVGRAVTLHLLTGDALFCQRPLARLIVEAGRAYLFAIKDNQPDLHEAAQTALADATPETADAGTREKKGARW